MGILNLNDAINRARDEGLDLIEIAPNAKPPGVNIGLFCSTPMVAVSRKINRKPMMKMLLTGEPIKANYAKEIGLIND